MPMVCVAAKYHADVSGLCSHLRPVLMSAVHVAAEGHVWVCCPDAARHYVDVHDLGYHLRPLRSL